MASILNGTVFRSVLANGQPNAFGKVYTYTAGTSSPLATYTTPDRDVPNTNPVVLDAAGCADVVLAAGVAYRIVEKTSGDVTIRDKDDISADSVPVDINAVDYGADPTGVEDSTSAIQAAINAAYGKRLVIPKGTYKITNSLNVIGSGITISGEQFGNVTLRQDTDNTAHIKIGDGTLGNRPTRVTVENLQLIPRSGAASWTTAYAVTVSYASFVNINNVDVYGADDGVSRIYGGFSLDRVQFSNIYDCWARSIRGSGVYTVGAAGVLTSDIRIMNTYVMDFQTNGFHFSDYTNGHFVVNAEVVTSVGSNAVYLDSNPSNGGTNFFFSNFNAELSGTSCDGMSFVRGSLIQVQDGWWGASSGKSAVRVLSGASNVSFSGCWTSEGRWLIEGDNVKIHGPGTIGSLAPASSAALTIEGATASIVEVKDIAFTQFTGGGVEAVDSPTYVTISGNDFAQLGGGTPISGALGTGSQITNNVGDTSRATAASITVGSSPYTYTAGNRPESVHITGGTVSAITIGGVNVATATNHTVFLPPNSSVVVTHSGTPTMIKVLQ